MEPPFFSVIVPTYQRARYLRQLLEALTKQTFQDFEVLVVDQSEIPPAMPASLSRKLRLKTIQTNKKGAVGARNRGIQEARGAVLAFTDDDCVPSRDWLERAAEHFDRSSIAGLEGRIWTSKQGHPRYRTVTNVGFEGFGFMTANLFLRTVLVKKVGGFDERFDNPHFREDTDLAWRVLEKGEIPYATDVAVYHPPHPVRMKRESPEERAKMFVQDPLLFAKHPERYPRLFFAEAHYRKTKGFWTYFLEGIQRHRVEIPLELLVNEMEHGDQGLWEKLNAAVEGNYGGSGDLVLSTSDITALRSLIGQEGTPKCFSAK
jgi:glycosyltransferase involved in cell wall biosynthesis